MRLREGRRGSHYIITVVYVHCQMILQEQEQLLQWPVTASISVVVNPYFDLHEVVVTVEREPKETPTPLLLH